MLEQEQRAISDRGREHRQAVDLGRHLEDRLIPRHAVALSASVVTGLQPPARTGGVVLTPRAASPTRATCSRSTRACPTSSYCHVHPPRSRPSCASAARPGCPCRPARLGHRAHRRRHRPAGGVMVSLTRMTQILELDLVNRCATVQPGLINLWLTNAVRRARLVLRARSLEPDGLLDRRQRRHQRRRPALPQVRITPTTCWASRSSPARARS